MPFILIVPEAIPSLYPIISVKCSGASSYPIYLC